ncbi:hypothetical protein HPB51_015888 [Rhipicephalus microplus]|uniref:Uncharacterized protein n=1 Tax=Rhipicephalus microplus TaxID=6941 RepID=A0A9J6DGZ9_RHIMP|nr:hypothetical protein HPB51_015888 [Rhipicephalus microplus]
MSAFRSFSWTAVLEPFVNHLLGFDPESSRMLASDSSGESFLASSDGTHWALVASRAANASLSRANFVPSLIVPALTRSDILSKDLIIGDWKAFLLVVALALTKKVTARTIGTDFNCDSNRFAVVCTAFRLYVGSQNSVLLVVGNIVDHVAGMAVPEKHIRHKKRSPSPSC